MSLGTGRLWRVIGTPWQEDMKRYASRTLRVEFDGPDLRDQQLWDILRVKMTYTITSRHQFTNLSSPLGALNILNHRFLFPRELSVPLSLSFKQYHQLSLLITVFMGLISHLLQILRSGPDFVPFTNGQLRRM